MAALTGAWKAKAAGTQFSDYVGSLKWGTGWNPIHAERGGEGRNIAPYEQSSVIPTDLTVQYDPHDPAYSPEDAPSHLWGYGYETGTADRPGWDAPDPRGDVQQDWPSWGGTSSGMPRGEHIRSVNKGADATVSMKVTPRENPTQGWLNKATSVVEDAGVSDPSQYEMQTSMRQRDQVRAGSQVAAGRENEYDAPIHSRIPAMKLKVYSGGERHYDMTPRDQDVIIRPFWARTAGTGYREWLAPNEMYVSTPLDRNVPDNPYTGSETPVDNSDTGMYGYTSEDISYV